MQSRIGPYRVGPHGLLQPIADAIKLMMKEDIVPLAADRWVYNLAPVVFLVPCVLIFATLPFAFLSAALVSVFFERTLYRRLYRASDLDQCLLTIGIVFISVAAFAWFFTTEQQSAPIPKWLQGSSVQ